jgi:hypothetical protein
MCDAGAGFRHFSAARNHGLGEGRRGRAQDYARLRVQGASTWSSAATRKTCDWRPRATRFRYSPNPIIKLYPRDQGARGADPHYTNFNEARPERARLYLEMMEADLAREPSGRLYAIAGQTAMYNAGDYDRAHRYLLKAAELGYRTQRSLEEAADAAYRGGNLGVAQDLYRGLYEQGYRTPALCLHRANLAVRSGDRGAARDLLRECLTLGGLGPRVNEVIERNIAHLES